jgi:hypothetical protein
VEWLGSTGYVPGVGVLSLLGVACCLFMGAPCGGHLISGSGLAWNVLSTAEGGRLCVRHVPHVVSVCPAQISQCYTLLITLVRRVAQVLCMLLWDGF